MRRRHRWTPPLATAECLERRALLSTINGTIFFDHDGDGGRDLGDPGTSGVTVYLDHDEDGTFDDGEPTTVTNADGFYQFNDLAAGEYYVRPVAPDGFRPAANSGKFYSIDVLNPRLMTIDNGVVTAVELKPQLQMPKPALHGLALTIDGELFALEANLSPYDALWKIHPATGSMARIGSTGQNHAWGMCYDPATDTIYGVAYIGGRVRLGTINQETGLFSAVPTGVGVPSTGGLNALTGTGGLAFDTTRRRIIAYDFHDGEIYSFALDGTAVKLSQTDAKLSGGLAFDGKQFVMEHRDQSTLIALDPDAGTWSVLVNHGRWFFEESLEYVPGSASGRRILVGDGETVMVRDLGLAPLPPMTWEAESSAFGHLIGRADGDGWSASTNLDHQGFLLFGPYTAAIPAGVQIATFRMLVDNTTVDNANVARVEVFDAATGGVLAQRVVTRGEFAARFQFQDVDLAFRNPAGSMLEFRVWWYDTSYVRVDRVRVTMAPVPPLVLEAESHFGHLIGRSTAEGWTASTALDNAGYLAFGPYTTTVPAGRQSATFRLRVDNNSANNAPIVTLDVHDAATDRTLAQRVVRRADFVAANAFQEFVLEFDNPFGSRLEFRVVWHDTALVTLDRVIVTQTPTPPLRTFEAEKPGVFGHQIGRATADGWSANLFDDGPGFLAFGPYTTALPAGSHVALFRLSVGFHLGENTPVVTFDVVDAVSGQRLAVRTITRLEFQASGTYQFFALPFKSSAEAKLEFRTWWHDTVAARLDSVSVIDVPSPQFLIETESSTVGHTTGQATAGGWSANVAQNAAGWLATGPYEYRSLPSGTYAAGFRLLVDNHQANNDPIVTIDVFDRTSGQVLARRTINRLEIQAANTFQEFGLTFTSAPEARLEYRTYWHGRSYVEQDSVSVRPATWTADELEPVFDEIEDLLLTA